MKVKNSFLVIFLGVFITLLSCKEEDKIENEISQISIDLLVERFDRIFNEANPADLPKLKETFPFLFSKRIPDSIWLKRMEDTLQKQLLSEVNTRFTDFSVHENDLYRLNQHLKYYDPLFKVPRIITLTNDVDYRNKVVVTDTIVLIALDNYLGASHKFYEGIPRYKAQNMSEDQIIPDLSKAYAERYIYQSQRKTLLDDMIYFGKRLYFADKIIPFAEDQYKIGYSKEQMEFAESFIWWMAWISTSTPLTGTRLATVMIRNLSEGVFSKWCGL